MTPTPGVVIEDMGHKMGCNGVDNGGGGVWGGGVMVARASKVRLLLAVSIVSRF